jgi:hypothetical protein
MEQEWSQEVDLNINYVTNGLHTLLLIRNPWKITGTIHEERKVFKFQVNHTNVQDKLLKMEFLFLINTDFNLKSTDHCS